MLHTEQKHPLEIPPTAGWSSLLSQIYLLATQSRFTPSAWILQTRLILLFTIWGRTWSAMFASMFVGRVEPW